MNPQLTQTMAQQHSLEMRARAADARRAAELDDTSAPRRLARVLRPVLPQRGRRQLAAGAAPVVPCD